MMNEVVKFEPRQTPLVPVAEIDAFCKEIDDLDIFDEPSSALKMKLKALIEPATPEIVGNSLAVLHALYGAARNPEVVAGVGVDLIMAEGFAIISVYEGTLRLLRPDPRLVRFRAGENSSEEEKPEPPRKFMPTIPEIIQEMRECEDRWQCQAKLYLDGMVRSVSSFGIEYRPIQRSGRSTKCGGQG
jgi:hypothetical protein